MNLDEYTEFDAVALSDLVRKQDVSSAELIACAEDAIARINPAINAVIRPVHQDRDAPIQDGPFTGVPFLLKDLGHNFAGIACTMGSRIGRGFVPKEDGPLAARFRAGGLRPVGVTNSSEFGINGVTEPVAFGPTRNPWDPTLSPGGSSGGSAAAVAAGIVPMAHASDGGGSIRVPAAWCGLVGLKPSRGRNPLGSGTSNDATSWVSAQHVVSRSLRDTAAALDVTSGPLPGDYIAMPRHERSFLEELKRAPERLRIALMLSWPDGPNVDEDCRLAAFDAGRLAESLGHIVEEIGPRVSYDDMSDLCRDIFLPSLAEGVERTSAATGLPMGPDTLECQTLAAIKRLQSLSAMDLKRDLSKLAAMSRQVGAFMADYDVLLTPAVSRSPVEIGRFNPESYPPDSITFWSDEMSCYAFSALSSLTGQPSMTLPLSETAEGLPVGVQINGHIGDDATLFQLAAQFEAAAPWDHRRPALHAAAKSNGTGLNPFTEKDSARCLRQSESLTR